MKLTVVKIVSMIMTLIGIISIILFTIYGNMMYGWLVFVAMMLLSGIIGYVFFRCPHCKKQISINNNLNQKYCPYCHEDLGVNPGPFSYYSRCHRKKNGMYCAYTIIGPAAAIVTALILFLIVLALLGADGLSGKTGIILIVAVAAIGILIGILSRCITGSAARLDDIYLYYSTIPFRWKKYELSEIKEVASEIKPFYHSVRGIVCSTRSEVITLPVTTYKGGREFMEIFADKIGIEPVDADPERVVSMRAEEGRQDEEKYREYVIRLKKVENR